MTIVNVNLINVGLATEPAKRGLVFKVDELVGAVRDLEAREKYALDARLYDTLVMRGIVESEDEYMRLKRIAHRTGRIKEQEWVNGAWVTATS